MTTLDFIIAFSGIVLGSSGLFTFLIKLIDKKDETSKELTDIKNELKESKLSSCRTELLILMNHYPNEQREIYRLGQKYFRDLGGDFYMTALFANWLKEHNQPMPVWLKLEEDD